MEASRLRKLKPDFLAGGCFDLSSLAAVLDDLGADEDSKRFISALSVSSVCTLSEIDLAVVDVG